MNEKRPLELIVIEDSVLLRIGARELMVIIENDSMLAYSLMSSVAGHLMGTVVRLRSMCTYSAERGVDFSEFDCQ